MVDNSKLEAAIQKGLEAGGAGKDAGKIAAGKLSAAYNAASGLISGLEILSDMRHSTFEYKVMEVSDHLCISTNIPTCLIRADLREKDKLRITVESNGEISAVGDICHGRRNDIESVSTQNGEAAPILEFVAKKAALKGLVR